MTTITQNEITGQEAKKLRKDKGMSQKAFWRTVGASQPAGAQYEAEAVPIPESIRILIVTQYVAGVKLDTATETGVNDIAKLANVQAAQAEIKKARRAIKNAAESVGE